MLPGGNQVRHSAPTRPSEIKAPFHVELEGTVRRHVSVDERRERAKIFRGHARHGVPTVIGQRTTLARLSGRVSAGAYDPLGLRFHERLSAVFVCLPAMIVGLLRMFLRSRLVSRLVVYGREMVVFGCFVMMLRCVNVMLRRTVFHCYPLHSHLVLLRAVTAA
jgi:hypothetical protein